MKSILLTAEQRTYLYDKDRGLWRKMLALLRRMPRLEYPQYAITVTGPADTIEAIERILYG